MPVEEMNPYLYALIAQYEALGMISLGKVPDPAANETRCDLARAKLVIDTVEMLEAKTQGNLTETEDRELKRILTLLRLNYVEEVNRTSAEAQASGAAATGTQTEEPAGEKAEKSPPRQGEEPTEEQGEVSTEEQGEVSAEEQGEVSTESAEEEKRAQKEGGKGQEA